ncbi:uncharacterized protein LOC130637019 [Hydractinia symbiolongicarpus]|uniref:uncharacterized protein LOC130637019 n=1 Tax=Hydractinia symbiolongicarpus TaxID=13093 RepID=UPI00255139B0|nr:uncharacterized protein LOC130637019 [Hydractinia symbiolongicarpus]
MSEKIKKLSFEEEEKLAFRVEDYPCLFDKTDRGYKEKDCVKNAWEEVANSLEFLENGNAAKTSFEKLRKRYNKKKNDFKKSKKSGTSTKESEKAEKALELYKYLSWLDNFIYVREGRSNIYTDYSSDEEGDEDTELPVDLTENEDDNDDGASETFKN